MHCTTLDAFRAIQRADTGAIPGEASISIPAGRILAGPACRSGQRLTRRPSSITTITSWMIGPIGQISRTSLIPSRPEPKSRPATSTARADGGVDRTGRCHRPALAPHAPPGPPAHPNPSPDGWRTSRSTSRPPRSCQGRSGPRSQAMLLSRSIHFEVDLRVEYMNPIPDVSLKRLIVEDQHLGQLGLVGRRTPPRTAVSLASVRAGLGEHHETAADQARLRQKEQRDASSPRSSGRPDFRVPETSVAFAGSDCPPWFST